jgi:M6 family metalloprotease-like protein
MPRFTRFLFFSAILVVLMPSCLESAPLRYLPVTLRQPDGSSLQCFASGDEHYNWLHDAEGYTIIRDPRSGWYTYAVPDGNTLVASTHIPGRAQPELVGLTPWLKMQDQIEIARRFGRPGLAKGGASIMTPTKGTINNIVVFIRFSEDDEFANPSATYEDMFNTGTGSMQEYFKEVSHDVLTVSSTFYPPFQGTTVLSYKDTHPREYFMPGDESNPVGYTNDRALREHALLRDAIAEVSKDIPKNLVVDSDNDGNVDNVCFIVAGTTTAWSTLLWPHMWDLSSFDVRINGARIRSYNLEIDVPLQNDRAGVLSHEMQHSLGFPDLYHYSYDGLNPAGAWDLMEENRNPPQHSNSYMKWRYGHWIDSIPEITESGVYSLLPSSSTSNNCYKIRSPYAPQEYFVLEYRRRNTTFERSLPNEGLLIWRINSSYDGRGNSNGPPDEVYVYRQGGTATENGILTRAAFSADNKRTAINDKTDPASFLTSGTKGGLDISSIGESGDSITFTVNIIKPKPPLNPTMLTATPKSYNTIVLKWIDNADDESGYEIQAHMTGEDWHTILDTPADVTTVPVSGCFPETSYWFRVRAVNGSYFSSWTDSAYAITPPAPVPTNISAIALEERIVRVGWTNPTVEDRPVHIERQEPGGTWVRIDSVYGVSSYFDRNGLTPGTSYCYRVRAVYGNIQSAWSDSACAKPGMMLLHSPQRLRTGIVTSDAVQLYWDFDSYGETGFEVQRSESGGANDFDALTPDAGAGFDVYMDRSVLPGETWFYRVRTLKSTIRSTWSPVIRVDIPMEPTDRWVPANGPNCGYVTQLAMAGQNMYAATSGQGIMRSTDAGASWFNTTYLGDPFAVAVGASDNMLYVGTEGAGAFMSYNHGESWTFVPSAMLLHQVRAFATTGSTVYIGSTRGGLFRSTNDGGFWEHVDAVTDDTINTVCITGNMVFVGSTKGVWRSLDGGSGWTLVSSGMVHSNITSLIANKTSIFAGTATGGVYRSDDNGSSWNRQPKGMGNVRVTALACSGNSIFAGTPASGVFRSVDNGSTWGTWNNGLTDRSITALLMRDTILVAGTRGGGILRAGLLGAAWKAANSTYPGASVTSFASNGNDLLAATNGGGVFRTRDLGETWMTSSYNLTTTDISSLSNSGARMLAGTNGGGVFRSTNFGSTWTQVNNGLGDTIVAAVAVTNGSILASTYGAGLFRSTNDGLQWVRAAEGTIDTVVNAFAVSNNDVYACVEEKGVYHSSDGGLTWSPAGAAAGPTDGCSIIAGSSGLMVGDRNLGAQRLVSAGGMWEGVNNGIWSTHVTALAAYNQAVFAGTYGAGVFLTKNFGDIWREVNLGLNNYYITSLHVSGDYLYAGIEGGSVWRLYVPDVLLNTGRNDGTVIPSDVTLSGNYPNPFNPSTRIEYGLPSAMRVRLYVSDLRGRIVKLLADDWMDAGMHSVRFDATGLQSGTYICTLHAGNTIRSAGMTLLK